MAVGAWMSTPPAEPAGVDYDRIVASLVRAIEVAGIAVVVTGGVLATLTFLGRITRGRAFTEAYHGYRADLGRAILLGLEFLVAADIIGTVAIEPTFRSLGVLALIVAIRTFLSFALELEVSGRWPWQRGADAAREPKDQPSGERSGERARRQGAASSTPDA